MREPFGEQRLGPFPAAAPTQLKSLRAIAPVLPFALSALLSSALMFLVEPLFARAMLPELGGSPAVWNTCVVGFQLLLLAGYAYAHGSVTILGVRKQIVVHALLMLLSVCVLPFTLPRLHQRFEGPALSVLVALGITLALPFVLLAANSTLAQRWLVRAGVENPFPLYAASNAGSLAALLAYPVAYEPLLGLSRGWRAWAVAYVLFLALSAACMAIAARATGGHADDTTEAPADEPSRWNARFGWLMRSAVASSLLLSATAQITTDVAPLPLFWVLPLSLYLLSFVVAFSPALLVPRPIVAVVTALGIAWSLAATIYAFSLPLWLNVGTLLTTVFAGSLLCHQDLVACRPRPRHLTEFYLWIAAGGALGGMLNSIVAPVVFDSVAEFPITLLLLAGLIHARGGYLRRFPRERMRAIATYLPPFVAVAALTVAAVMVHRMRAGAEATETETLLWRLIPLAVILQGLLLARHAGQMELAIALVTTFAVTVGTTLDPVIVQRRSFFGISRVLETPRERILVHGTTAHGAQRREPSLSRLPTRYFHPNGPYGRATFPEGGARSIGIVGLGVGSLAMIGQPADRITFFEIDPAVEEIARGQFTFLRDTPAHTEVVIGDGRVLLRARPDHAFDVLAIDAFNSDAVPTHLLTKEALDLYLRKVRPDGLVLLQIANRHLDLSRVFRGWAHAEKRRVAFFAYVPGPADLAQGAASTVVVAIAPDEVTLQKLVAGGRWRWLGRGREVVWTDDRVDLLRVIGPIRL